MAEKVLPVVIHTMYGGGSGSQTLTHIYEACPNDSLSEAYNAAKSTFVFMRTAECISKLRAIPREMLSLAPIHRQLEIFTELLGLFPPRLSMDKTRYMDKTMVYKYILRNGNFFPMTFGKKLSLARQLPWKISVRSV